MELRQVARDELRSVHEARIATWRTAYRGIVPDAYLDALALTDEMMANIEARYDEGSARTVAAWDDRTAVGMAVAGPCRDEDRAGEQELYALYVLPSHWGTGLGGLLWDAVMPFTSLWVLADNARARAFYARRGFRPEALKQITFGGDLTEVRYVLA
ncbi:MAG TPA: GNAT family N-acetyltransferase [Mycobacteriales bacterium]|nr:GNAT family N-acetyltransferase [Mycobacteriales bacterium]